MTDVNQVSFTDRMRIVRTDPKMPLEKRMNDFLTTTLFAAADDGSCICNFKFVNPNGGEFLERTGDIEWYADQEIPLAGLLYETGVAALVGSSNVIDWIAEYKTRVPEIAYVECVSVTGVFYVGNGATMSGVHGLFTTDTNFEVVEGAIDTSDLASYPVLTAGMRFGIGIEA